MIKASELFTEYLLTTFKMNKNLSFINQAWEWLLFTVFIWIHTTERFIENQFTQIQIIRVFQSQNVLLYHILIFQKKFYMCYPSMLFFNTTLSSIFIISFCFILLTGIKISFIQSIIHKINFLRYYVVLLRIDGLTGCELPVII